jgi:hypothetical protein
MATQFDNIFVPLAKKLIDATFGFTATLRKVTQSYDAGTGKTTDSNSDTAVKVTPPKPYQTRHINNTTILEGDAWVTMSTQSSVVPELNDRFIISGVTWQVVRIDPIVSGEETAAYKVQLRQ